jgi:cytosine deaminase
MDHWFKSARNGSTLGMDLSTLQMLSWYRDIISSQRNANTMFQQTSATTRRPGESSDDTTLKTHPDYAAMLQTAIAEARIGLAEGGIPIGAALYNSQGTLLGRGRNRRVQENDPSVHGETDAFRKAGRQQSYRDKIMVTTLAPCWYCSGLIVQFKIGKVVVGESKNFRGGMDWLRERGVEVIEMNSGACEQMLSQYITAHPDIWNEDIGEGEDEPCC